MWRSISDSTSRHRCLPHQECSCRIGHERRMLTMRGLAWPSNSSRIDKKRPRVTLQQQVVEELAAIRAWCGGKDDPFRNGPVSLPCSDCKSLDPLCNHVHHWIGKNEAVPADTDIDFPARGTDINLHNIRRQSSVLRGRRCTYLILSFPMAATSAISAIPFRIAIINASPSS